MIGSRGNQLVVRWGVLTVAIVSCFGCGGSGRPKTIPISGKITIDGKPPGERGKLHFQVIKPAEGYAARPASAWFDAEGGYRVMSWAPDDGLVPGKYTVSFMPGAATTKIPAKYQQAGTSGLEVDVPVDQGKIDYNIEIHTK